LEHGLAADAPGWLAALQHSALAQVLRGSLWLYPAVETLHVAGLALLVGAIAVFDARVVRAGPGFDLGGWSRSVLPVARAGFALAAAMGLLLFTVEATAYAANPAFQAKLALIALALANVGAFHLLARRVGRPTTALRVTAAASLALWLLVLACGRLIAYV
jgi:hypothetical protein